MNKPMHVHDDSDAGCLERVRPTEAGGTIYRCTAPGIYPTGIVVVVQPGGRPFATELAKAPR